MGFFPENNDNRFYNRESDIITPTIISSSLCILCPVGMMLNLDSISKKCISFFITAMFYFIVTKIKFV